jgi:hypothetical protein
LTESVSVSSGAVYDRPMEDPVYRLPEKQDDDERSDCGDYERYK